MNTKIQKFILLILFLSVSIVFAKEQPTLTVYGKIDPRLKAEFMSIYRSANLENKKCTSKHIQTGNKRPRLTVNGAKVDKGGDYSITVPLTYSNENGCEYEFVKTDLRISRKYDKNLYSKFPLISTDQWIMPIYKGDKHGEASVRDGISVFATEKKYFAVADQTSFMCKTHWYEYRQGSDFYCLMQLMNDKSGDKFYIHKSRHYHPEFGIDTLGETTLLIDILVDEEACTATTIKEKGITKDRFREIEKPSYIKKIINNLKENYSEYIILALILLVPMIIHYVLIRDGITILITLIIITPIAIVESNLTGMGAGMMIFYSVILYYFIMFILTVKSFIKKRNLKKNLKEK